MTSPPLAPHQLEPHDQPPRPVVWAWSVAKFIVVVVLIAVIFVAGRDLAERLAERVSPDPNADPGVVTGLEVDLEIPPGASARAIAVILVDEGVIADAAGFELAVQASGKAAQLKAGRYMLVSGTSNEDLVAALVAGPAPIEVYRVTIVEGLRMDAMLESLADQTPYAVEDLEQTLLSGAVFSSYLPDDVPDGVTELQAWEGLLFPDTYEFRADAPPEEILQRMASTLESRVDAVDWTVFEERGLTLYEGIIIASLIEREAKLDDDRPLISSVIRNRLDADMALQIDATVIYAIGENRGRVLDADLEIDSPYNTYRIAGLPPTPIGGVRLLSLEAAAAPAETDFFYYVVVDEDGRHGFSVTLEEHNEKVAEARQAGILP